MGLSPEALQLAAYKRIEGRRAFWPHFIAYLTVGAVLILVWALATPGVIFWPAFPLAGWGIGIVFHAWAAFVSRPITQVDVERELQRWGYRDGGGRAV